MASLSPRQAAARGPCARLLVPLLLLACGCARLPALTPVSGSAPETAEAICRRPFPDRPWRAVHALQISGPMDHDSALLGVTLVDPSARRVRAVVLSLEGLVLFDATGQGGTVQVHRALPPLDRKGFPEGLMRDVELLFLPPRGALSPLGQDAQEQLVCRWTDEASGTTDLVFEELGRWDLFAYGTDHRLQRTARMVPGMQGPLAAEIQLTGHGLLEYTLDLTLLEAQFLQGDYEGLFTAPPD